jgi:putative transposase
LHNASSVDQLFPRRYNSLRLPGFDHSSDTSIFFVTLDTQPWRPVFADFTLAKAVLKSLLNPITQRRLRTLVYSLMPDHFHLLLRALNNKDLSDSLGSLKGLTTSQYWKRGREILQNGEVERHSPIAVPDRGDKREVLDA